jgi:hypothetical protein
LTAAGNDILPSRLLFPLPNELPVEMIKASAK